MMDVPGILDLQKKNITDWHRQITLTKTDSYWSFVEENNMWNFKLWHEEDIARIKDIDPLRIVEAKRSIDTFNQNRNNAIEKIDEWVLTALNEKNHPAIENMHSETPGMMIDRLSIMALKHYHMVEETTRAGASASHRERCSQKAAVLEEQIADLAFCLEKVLAQLEAGNLKFKVYRQFKMYNDPSLNPQLYKRQTGTRGNG